MDWHLDSALNWLGLVCKLLPVVLQMVGQVENIFQGQGKGEQKKAVILETVNAVAQSAGVKAADIPKVTSAISRVIDAQVSSLNGVLNRNVVSSPPLVERRAQ